ncbi:threonine aldolase [Pseudoalteromonas carrageenovora]|uniref:Threonine aldolase n=1 Tax=Pseudoalteromonas carrageenovora IAM 12662 TaxID=1314868 RepID=A0A2K4XF12_PSEVC|nr:low-specificity L-threonine aldolase [Pseudoalteromonas carrageenovora]MBE0384532.1 threonine aldolase [Pseudoalteromonas carrageenovora IAM 12662]QBJ73632.1 threonine aldolase [Pseudoalteromonas carrageenovora]GEB70829.1 threonine aldolase [Pseudoalteromonas carrageenovora]SOU42916.1 L-allo-threonine aldolase, PLP-dependent [Pseudoalteromonas carrageenovora IAM 12662]
MIDFRSDTVTQPSKAMRDVMYNAPVGDDVYGDDPSVNQLESYACERFNFEAALYCSSGTQANLLALMAHCERGDEYICGQNAHNYKFEGGGAAVLGSIQPQPIENEKDGSLCFNKVAAAIKPDDSHFANTRLLSLENTIGGKVLPLEYLAQARDFVNTYNLALHLDGARAFNAAAELNVDITAITKHFDSVSICLSKGLGAPIGSLLLGSQELINKARRWRKVLGGGMRQAGMLAAAGQYALENNVTRLSDDHGNARYLANKLNELNGFSVDMSNTTNMVYASYSGGTNISKIANELAQQGILISPSKQLRLVTHLDITGDDIDIFLNALSAHI